MHSTIDDILKSTDKRVLKIRCSDNPECIRKNTECKVDIATAIKGKKKEGKVAVIAEVKPASPGKKLMDIYADDAAHIAAEMQSAGAVVISVLTEPDFFFGSIENLEAVRHSNSLPVLRKDFIIDPIQIDEVESDMILLIAGVLGEDLKGMVEIALAKGFEPLVEVHDRNELEMALKTKTRMIGINNRDLNTLKIDLGTTVALVPIIRDFDRRTGSDHIIVSESGMQNTDDIKRVITAGADAVLVGSSIIKSGEFYKTTKLFVDAFENEKSFKDGEL